LEKCWIASGFDFTGYDILYLPAPAAGKIKSADDLATQQTAGKVLQRHMMDMFYLRSIFTEVTIDEPPVTPGKKTLKLTTTIMDYAKGNEFGRHYAGLFGVGYPELRIQGVATDGEKTMFTFTVRRSGDKRFVSEGPDEYVQMQDIHSMVLDLTDFVAAIAGKYTPDD
jgi:hypothetical protein